MEQCKNGKAVATDVFSISSAGFFYCQRQAAALQLFTLSVVKFTALLPHDSVCVCVGGG
jgi:hypothetical protein